MAADCIRHAQSTTPSPVATPTTSLNSVPRYLAPEGFQIHRAIFSLAEIQVFRNEADQLAKTTSSVCVRNISSLSCIFATLSRHPRLLALLPAESSISNTHPQILSTLDYPGMSRKISVLTTPVSH